MFQSQAQIFQIALSNILCQYDSMTKKSWFLLVTNSWRVRPRSNDGGRSRGLYIRFTWHCGAMGRRLWHSRLALLNFARTCQNQEWWFSKFSPTETKIPARLCIRHNFVGHPKLHQIKLHCSNSLFNVPKATGLALLPLILTNAQAIAWNWMLIQSLGR